MEMFEYPRHDWNTFVLIGCAVYFGTIYQFNPKSIPFRIILFIFLQTAFICSTIIIGLMMNWIIEIHYYPKLESFEDIIGAGYNVSGESFAFAKHPELVDKFILCDNTEACLSQLNLDQHLAVAISNEYFQNIPKIFKEDVYCLTEYGFSSTHGLHFLLRNDTGLKSDLDRFILLANEGGLIFKWMADLSARQILKNEDIILREHSMKIMWSLGFICGSLILLATNVFLAEIIIHKQRARSYSQRFWTLAEQLIDPDRHLLNYDLRYMLPLSYHQLDIETTAAGRPQDN